MNEATTTTSTATVSVTIDSLLETVEMLRKQFPDLEKCQHHELITSKWLPKDRYMCIRCHKLLIVPPHLFLTQEEAEFQASEALRATIQDMAAGVSPLRHKEAMEIAGVA